MMRCLAALGLVLLAWGVGLVSPAVARAADEPVALIVTLEDGTPYGIYELDASLLVGSSSECGLWLEGTRQSHLLLVREGDVIQVTPLEGRVRLNRRVQNGRFSWAEGVLRVGRYRIRQSGSRAPGPEPLPSEASTEEAVSYASYLLPTSEEEDTPPSVETGDRAIEARQVELGKESYRFCHDPEYGKDGTAGIDFCVLLDEETVDACPEAFKSCPQWKRARLAKFPLAQGGKSGGRSFIRRSDRSFSMPDLPGPIAWFIVITVLVGVVFLFIQAIMKAGWEDEELDLGEVELTEAARQLQALPETRCQVLVRMAQNAVERGDPEEGAILLHLAILRYLDDEDLARYHPSKTNGDYVRAIRRHKSLAALFKGAALQTERVRFGDGHVDAEALRNLLERAQTELDVKGSARHLPASMLGLLAVGMLGGFACGGSPDRAYYDHEPMGMAALPAILEQAGLTVEISRGRLHELPEDTRVAVLRTGTARIQSVFDELRIDTLLDRGLTLVVIDDRGSANVFLPSRPLVERPRPAKAMTLELFSETPVPPCLDGMSALFGTLTEGPVRVPKGRRLLWDGKTRTTTVSRHPVEATPFLIYAGLPTKIVDDTVAHAWSIERMTEEGLADGCVHLFADRDLFTNASLARPANARFVAAYFASMVTEFRPRIVLVDRLDPWSVGASEEADSERPDPARALEASNMLPWLLQTMLTLVVLYVFLGAAFGPLRDPAVTEHKAFSDHVEALGRQYARMGQRGLTHAATLLAKLLVHRYRERLRGGGGWTMLAEDLAGRYNLDVEHVRAALRLGIDGKSDLGAPGPSDPSPSSEVMLRTLTHLLSGRRVLDTEGGS